MTVPRTVNLSIDTDNDADFSKAFEVAGRLAAGLIIEGMEVRLYAFLTPDVDDE